MEVDPVELWTEATPLWEMVTEEVPVGIGWKPERTGRPSVVTTWPVAFSLKEPSRV